VGDNAGVSSSLLSVASGVVESGVERHEERKFKPCRRRRSLAGVRPEQRGETALSRGVLRNGLSLQFANEDIIICHRG
jgi:hypothetical protein